VHETAAERSNRIANNQVQLLLASVEDASISPSEFLTLIKDTAHASHQKMEDNVFIRLYRGCTAEDMANWVIFPPDNDDYTLIYLPAQVNILNPYSVPVQSYRAQVDITRSFEYSANKRILNKYFIIPCCTLH
jgi:hypothetical protein